MRRLLLPLFLLVGLVGLWLWIAGDERTQGPPPPNIRMVEQPAPGDFARVVEPRAFTFPLDHGPHPEYQTEWWYFTGNLESTEGGHFGYQLTFFRRALSPGVAERDASFATNQIYFAHLAITDVPGSSHVEVERFSRGAAGLAGASGEPFQVWIEDWRLDSLNEPGSSLKLSAREGDFGLELQLDAQKPIVPHGMEGLSPKSDEPGNASYYLSYTRLETWGTLLVQGAEIEVQGTSWFDHEWSTSALGEDAQGWDWFGLQLSDGREVMLGTIRNVEGTIDPISGGTLVEADGNILPLGADDFEVQVLDRWTSPDTGAEYPASWRISIPNADLELELEPWLKDQEMNISVVYWEGAVRITGVSNGTQIMGNGYVELTGYAQSFQGLF